MKNISLLGMMEAKDLVFLPFIHVLPLIDTT